MSVEGAGVCSYLSPREAKSCFKKQNFKPPPGADEPAASPEAQDGEPMLTPFLSASDLRSLQEAGGLGGNGAPDDRQPPRGETLILN